MDVCSEGIQKWMEVCLLLTSLCQLAYQILISMGMEKCLGGKIINVREKLLFLQSSLKKFATNCRRFHVRINGIDSSSVSSCPPSLKPELSLTGRRDFQ